MITRDLQNLYKNLLLLELQMLIKKSPTSDLWTGLYWGKTLERGGPGQGFSVLGPVFKNVDVI